MYEEIKAKTNQFPRLGLGHFPSPIRKVSFAEGKAFWVKDDGVISEVYGGNKVRKLEYLLADARRRNKRRLVVQGDMESHTVMACCLFGRQAGFEVDAVIFPHGRQAFDSQEIQHLVDAGVSLHRMKTMLATVCYAGLLGLRRGSYLIPLGGSTPLSSLGYVHGAVELCEQIRQQLLPEPERIFLPFATGGSVAGILIGLALVGSPVRVVAVQTVEGIIANRGRLNRLIKATLPLIGVAETFSTSCLERLETIDRRFLGTGYRDIPLPVSSAVRLASDFGLDLEPVFSGKALASLLDARAQNGCGELLFWNTHSRQSAGLAEQIGVFGKRQAPCSDDRLCPCPPKSAQ